MKKCNLMKVTSAVCMISALFLLHSVAIAAEKVVVIPLGGAKNYMYWQGQWAVGTNFKIGDGVQYDGSSYVCVMAHVADQTNIPPSAYWDLLAAQGEPGPSGANNFVLSNKYTASATASNGYLEEVEMRSPPSICVLTTVIFNRQTSTSTQSICQIYLDVDPERWILKAHEPGSQGTVSCAARCLSW